MDQDFTSRRIDTGTRLGSMFIDHVIMSFAAAAFAIPGMVQSFAGMFNVSHENEAPITPFSGGYWYVVLAGFALYFCKDMINGRSPAKRIFKLQVVDNTTGLPASPLKCLVRDLFTIIWPIEFIVALSDTSRRLGDRVAGTRLVWYDATVQQPKVQPGKVMLGIVVAYAAVLLMFLPIKYLAGNLDTEPHSFVSASYNQKESMALQTGLAAAYGNVMEPDVHVYDRLKTGEGRYISIIVKLRVNLLDDSNEAQMNELLSGIRKQARDMFPEQANKGRIKCYYKEGGSFQMNTTYL